MPRSISHIQLNRATLERQGLIARQAGPVPDVVARLAGLQAQHSNAPYVALWSRREGQAISHLEEALEKATVVKATLMRATLHLVDSGDYPAYDRATAESRVAAWGPTARKDGIDLAEANDALRGFCAEPRTVAEMYGFLQDRFPGLGDHAPAGVRNTAFRMASAAGGLVHVPPSGLWKRHERPRYIDSRRWLESEDEEDASAALRIATEQYLGAYGPASAEDILKWVGERRITKVRAALDALGDQVVHHTGPDGRPLVDLAEHQIPDGDADVPVRFLSRWDSSLIGYQVRDRILPDALRDAVIKKNGDFLPTFLVDGFVAGLWSVDVADGGATLELTPLSSVPKAVRASLEEEGGSLLRYIEPDVAEHEVRWIKP